MSQWVDLKVGFTCNNRCIHCVISDKTNDKDLSLEEIKQLLQEYIQEYGTIQLTLTGGEVTIRKDFPQIIAFIAELKQQGKITFVDMQTNARMLSKDEVLAPTIGVVDFFLVALHSFEAETHDSITSSRGSFEQTTTALGKIVNKAGPKAVAIQTVINRKNFKDLKRIYQFVFETYGITEFNITFPHPIGVCNSCEIVPTYAEVQPYVNEALSYCLENGIRPYIEALPYCIFREDLRQYAIDFYKERAIHVVGYAGESDGKIDYQELSASGHAMYPSCDSCPMQDLCEGVWSEHVRLYPNEDMLALMK